MDRMTRSVVESRPAGPFEMAGPPSQAGDFRTLLTHRLLGAVLPAITLLSMSALTVATIVVIVTTVAHAGWLEPGTYVRIDPWEALEPGPAILREDDILYPDAVTGQGPQPSDPSFDPQARSATDAGYFAAEMAP